jgi:UDP-N-acetyl-D-mannosaminuronic acid transferase (WecB/TagA/CpsF family)
MSSAAAVRPSPAMASYPVLDVRVDAVQIHGAIAEIERWIQERGPARYISVTGMHGVTESLQDPQLREILNASALVAPPPLAALQSGRVAVCLECASGTFASQNL